MPRRRHVDLAALDALSLAQRRCVTLAQLTEVGVSPSTVAYRTRPERGTWRRVLPGVVLLHRGTPTQSELEQAAVLYAGEGCVLTGSAALVRAGLRNVEAGAPLHVLVPNERTRASVRLLVVERTIRMPEPVVIAGLPYAPVPRALVDHARRLREITATRAMVAEAVQRRRAGQHALLGEIRAAQRRGTAAIRRVGEEIVAGIRSVEEARLRQVILGAGLPEPEWNVDLLTPSGEFVAAPDGYYREHGVAVELNSREWHLSPDTWEATQDRWRRMTRMGLVVVPVTPRVLRTSPSSFTEELAQTLRAHERRVLPDLVAVRRSQAA